MNNQERKVTVIEARKRPEWWRRLNKYREADFAKRERRLKRRRLEREEQARLHSFRVSRPSQPVPKRSTKECFYERVSATEHEHQISEVKLNHKWREFVSCLTCGAISFGD